MSIAPVVASPKRKAVARPKSPLPEARTAPGAASPKRRAAALPEWESGERPRPVRVRPLSHAEQEAKKEADKQAQIARRGALQDEFVGLKKQQEIMLAEVNRIDNVAEGGVEVHLGTLKADVARLQAEERAQKERKKNAERRLQELTQYRSQEEVSMKLKRADLEKEVLRVRDICARHEDEAHKLFGSSADMREVLQRGADELQQLRMELWERQGEKALLVAEQASAARLGAEQRVRAVAAEAQVTKLAQALDCEDSRLGKEQRRLRQAETQQFERDAGARRELALASNALPDQIQKERDESARCKKIAEDKRHELQVVKEALAKTREEQRHFAELEHSKSAEAWRAETACAAARTSREAMEAEAVRISSETKQIQVNVARLAEQNRQLLLTQVKAKNECSALVQDDIRRDVQDFLKANPDLSTSSDSKAERELEVRAARLGLAGFVTKMSRAGVVGPQR